MRQKVKPEEKLTSDRNLRNLLLTREGSAEEDKELFTWSFHMFSTSLHIWLPSQLWDIPLDWVVSQHRVSVQLDWFQSSGSRLFVDVFYTNLEKAAASNEFMHLSSFYQRESGRPEPTQGGRPLATGRLRTTTEVDAPSLATSTVTPRSDENQSHGQRRCTKNA
ncbi:unnamed protein product [Pleuronectes platessa]|uniref:Uncharacterized protein n=1 Tax=Pleuronectes platessa TaxID=8262 RepID=A0A9N7VRT7_PLEPL|nr:unnamed protein product [Pleuronectes platessa]